MVFSTVTTTLDYLATPLIDANSKQASLGRGQKCWKYTQYIISTIFILFSCIAIWQGTNALTAQTADGQSARHNQKWPIGMIVAGSLTIVFSLIGVAAIKMESFRLLIAYIALTTVASIVMLVIACMVLTTSMPDIAGRWTTMTPARAVQIQTNLNCCGLYATGDSFAVQPCPATPAGPCLPAIQGHISHVITIAGAVGISLSVVMLMTLASTAVLAVAFKRKHIYVRTGGSDDFGMASIDSAL